MGGTGEFPPATEILRVEVEPNPVAVGDTAVLTCVIEDSLESGFIFVWMVDLRDTDTTTANQYKWTAPPDTGTYVSQVRVNKPNAEVSSVQKSFEVKVIENN